MTLLDPALTTLTPRLELHVPTALTRFRQLRAALPSTAVHYAVKANPHPVLLARAGGGGVELRRGQPGRGTGVPRRRRPRRPTSCTQPDQAPRRHRLGGRAGRPAVRRGLAGGDPQGRRGRAGDGRAVPDRDVRQRLRLAAVAQVRLLHVRGRRGAPPRRGLGLDAAGVSFHVGSQQRDPSAWDAPIEASSRVFAALRQAGLRPWLLDLGGGFPAALEGGAPALDAYGAAIRRSLRKRFGSRRPRTIIEPGRSIVADAGRLVTSVVAVVHRGDTRWVYLDAGVFTGLVETLDEAIRYRLETEHDGGPTGPCVLAGPTCDSADVLYEKQPVHLPLALAEGDRVVLDLGGRLHDVLLDGRVQRVRAVAHRARPGTGACMNAGHPPAPSRATRWRPSACRCRGRSSSCSCGNGPATAGSSASPARPGCCRTSRCPGRRAGSRTATRATASSG